MNRQELEKFIFNTYGVSPEYPWAKYPSFAVFRHENNKKWFAVIMTISKDKIFPSKEGKITVVNLKCDTSLVPLLFDGKEIFPAYHMSKEHWITVNLDSDIDSEKLKFLLSISFDLTKK